MDLKLSPADKLSRGIIRLQRPQPFFAYLLMGLKPRVFPENIRNSPNFMPTMGVTPKGELYYEPEFVEKLSMPEIFGVLCHEVLHVALLHPMRTGNRIQPIANLAQDVVVNMIVKKTGESMSNNRYSHYGRGADVWKAENYVEMELPKDTIPVDVRNDSSTFPIPGTQANITIEKVSLKAWEEIYAEIIDQMKEQQQNPNNAQRPRGSGFDNHLSGESMGMSAKEMADAANKWQGNIAEAAQYAKSQGKLPGGMNRIIDELLKPKVVWKQLLMKFLRPHIQPVDWTYQRPHKKSQAQSMQHVKMGVTFVDAEIHTRYEVENGDIPKILAMKPGGGGGTDMELGLDHIKKTQREVPCVIVLTDGYTSFNRKAKDYPFDVIWVITEHGLSKGEMESRIPYGQRVKMEG